MRILLMPPHFLTGLNDFSFEEVRLEAIIANANGTGMAYVSVKLN